MLVLLLALLTARPCAVDATFGSAASALTGPTALPNVSHRAEREGDPGPVPRQQLVDIVGEADGATDGDVKVLERAAGFLSASADVLEEDVRVLGHEGRPEPAVCHLPRQLERVRAQCRQVDRNVRLRFGARAD